MGQAKLRFYKPFRLEDFAFTSESHNDIRQIIHEGAYTKGHFVSRLCNQIQEYTGYAHAIPFGGGTGAILALARWYLKLGYRTIRAPAFTWPSTYKPFEWLGYDIQFVDINKDTFLADFGDTDQWSNDLLCPVDTFGNVSPNDVFEFEWIDSAQSLGAKWDSTEPDRIVSLSGSKIVTSGGEGGMLLTQSKQFAEFAKSNDWLSRMPEMSAAIGLQYMKHIEEIIQRKRNLARAYASHLKHVKWQVKPYSTNDYIISGLVEDRQAFIDANPNVEFRIYYENIVNEEDNRKPMATQLHLQNTEYVSQHILAFPAWPDMPIERIYQMVNP